MTTKYETKIVVGTCVGKYFNAGIEKEFAGDVLLSVRNDGTLIVHNLDDGVRPMCYIDGGAKVTFDRAIDGIAIRAIAVSGDQKIVLDFVSVLGVQGIKSSREKGVLTKILQCIFDMGGNYGRTTVARVLTGSVSKKILTMNISKLKTYGSLESILVKNILTQIDWLLQENYLAYVESSEFPVIVVTAKGLDILAGSDFVKFERTIGDVV